MLSTEHGLEGLQNFLGYGNAAAPLWFVGGEEGFGGRMTEEEKAASLRRRASWKPIRDMYEAHMDFCEQGAQIDISRRRAGSIAVWLWMSRIALSLEGLPYSEHSEAYRNYTYENDGGLGRCNGSTFLTEVSAIPSAQASKHGCINRIPRAPAAGGPLSTAQNNAANLEATL